MIAGDMLHIVTCAKQGDAFIPLDDLDVLKLEEPLYVDGSIRVTVRGEPLITDAQWTDIVHWWASMSTVLRVLSNGTQQSAEGYFSWPGTMLFEVAGETLTWTVRGAQTRVATLDRVPALRILMREYRRFFERMQVVSPRDNGDVAGKIRWQFWQDPVAVLLDLKVRFKPLFSPVPGPWLGRAWRRS